VDVLSAENDVPRVGDRSRFHRKMITKKYTQANIAVRVVQMRNPFGISLIVAKREVAERGS